MIGVDWNTFSLVEGRFALNLSTVNLSTVVWLDSGILRDRPICRSGMPLIYRVVDRWPGDAPLACIRCAKKAKRSKASTLPSRALLAARRR